jgi:hypothetical protein
LTVRQKGTNMVKLLVFVDDNGVLVGTLRADPIDIGNGKTIQAIPSPMSKHKHHVVELPDHLVGKPSNVTELHREVRRLLPT